MGFAKIADMPQDSTMKNVASGWRRTGKHLAYFRNTQGKWRASIVAASDYFVVVSYTAKDGWGRQQGVYPTLGEALRVAEALVALAE